jgi:hypothetical protein
MEDKTIYRIKKWSFLLTIIILNIIFSLITYKFKGVTVITVIYVLFKSKDVMSIIGIIIHNIVK